MQNRFSKIETVFLCIILIKPMSNHFPDKRIQVIKMDNFAC